MYALKWGFGLSEGVGWSLRGIREDGSFYGDIVVHSRDTARRRGATVSGRLPPDDVARLFELVAIIQREPSPEDARPAFGVLFERLSPMDPAQVQPVFEYRAGDEISSEAARAFMELVELLRPHVAASSGGPA